jgi:hypothetical protein
LADESEGKINQLLCKQCGGEMTKKRVSTYTNPACVSIFLGVILLFAFWPLGLVAIFIGLILGSFSKRYWICKKCSYKIEKW